MRWPTKVLKLPRATLKALVRFVHARAGVPPWDEDDPALIKPVSFPPDEAPTVPDQPAVKIPHRVPGKGGHR
jgi:hypothetical protein